MEKALDELFGLMTEEREHEKQATQRLLLELLTDLALPTYTP